jgi:hypothetical protein
MRYFKNNVLNTVTDEILKKDMLFLISVLFSTYFKEHIEYYYSQQLLTL